MSGVPICQTLDYLQSDVILIKKCVFYSSNEKRAGLPYWALLTQKRMRQSLILF